MMQDDAALLRSFLDDGSDAAFASLVQRHIALVYSVALRRVGGDTHLAQDISQKVFVTFARKAATLRGHASLSGWLYVSAQHASAELVRREQRRKQRESAAHSMHLENAAPSSDADPAQLRAVIEDAIVTLKSDERDAIILRFFEKRSFSEIGAELLVTDEAARKRVDRALEKLHATLSRRGITSTAAALGLVLSATATSSVPLGLASQISSVALAQAGAATASVFATVSSMVLPAAAAAVMCGWLIVPQYWANDARRSEIVKLSATVAGLAAVRSENDQLSRSIVAARDVHRAQTAAAISRPVVTAKTAATAKPTSNSLTLTTKGTIVWEGKPVTLDTYLENLKALQTTAVGGESKLVVAAQGVHIGQLFFVIDEARKAGIKHILVDSDAKPEPRATWSWF